MIVWSQNGFFDQCRLFLHEFRQKVMPFPYHPKGILLSEGFAFCAMCRMFAIDQIIESGVAYAYSTRIFARCFPEVPIQAYESCSEYYTRKESSDRSAAWPYAQQVLASFANVTLVNRDSRKAIPCFLQDLQAEHVAICLDGPKGDVAIDLGRQCLDSKRVVFVAIHDEQTHRMDQWGNTVFYTDDQYFRRTYGHLDTEAQSRCLEGDEHQPVGGQFPEGPVLGFAMHTGRLG